MSSKKILLSSKAAEALYGMLNRELTYKIVESGCAHEYADDIGIMIHLLELLGDDALDYKKNYETYRKEENESRKKGDKIPPLARY